MTLVEEYYELNEAEEVPAIWKVLQIAFYGASAGLGLWCGFTMAILRLKFGDRCYLFTKVEGHIFKNKTAELTDVDWEGDTWCDYYQFSLVSSFIVGIIWAAFYLMCGKGGKSLTGLPQPWRIVWPSLLFNLFYFLVNLGTSISVQQGTDFFCHINGSETRTVDGCESVTLLIKKEDLEMTLFQIKAVPKSSWACTISWLILFLLSLFRIVFLVDFRMYKICVFKIDDTIQNKREEVLRVTNYEEPKRLHYSKESTNDSFEDSLESLRPKKKDKSEKFRPQSSQFRPNTTYYLMADKMLIKQKKARNPAEGFGKNLVVDTRPHTNVQDRSEGSEIQPFFRQQSKPYDDDDDLSSTSTIQKPSFDDLDKSESENEILVGDPDQNRALKLKKLI